MAEHLANAFQRPKEKAHLLIVEARFHNGLADALLEGAQRALNEAGATFDVVTVPGALEIPAAMAFALDGGRNGGTFYDGFVALGCVIRGETTHYELVAGESCRGLMELGVRTGAAIGNGILTVENEAQALVRADPGDQDKGGGAALAALHLLAWRRALQA